ncbi:MAG: hypothetical protein D9V44_01430 [Actinobacteria bacterium]|nr:MAG: hypothetical protein D9V44_01430 [Actinomycetota bacterium]
MLRAVEVEFSKMRRSHIPLWTVAIVAIAPFMTGTMGSADRAWFDSLTWLQYVRLGPMNLSTWYGVLLLGLMTAFTFGREYTEGVVANVLTTPARREYWVLAKVFILGVWYLALAVLSVVMQSAWAAVLGKHGFDAAGAWTVLSDTLRIALLLLCTMPVVALTAVVTRGVLAPMILSALGFSAGMIGGIAGWGDWLVWAMPTTIAGSFMQLEGQPAADLATGSWLIAIGVFVVGLFSLVWYVDRADVAS